ncbi:hypothetical protein, partial [Campylobacter magnus]|uniref:hypothetical protein n=1 Tax=Campylobacter magnus TaxID=3026462 RepID=UPI0026DF63DC
AKKYFLHSKTKYYRNFQKFIKSVKLCRLALLYFHSQTNFTRSKNESNNNNRRYSTRCCGASG